MCQSSRGCQVDLPSHNRWLLSDAPTLRSGTSKNQALEYWGQSTIALSCIGRPNERLLWL